eukprot:m.20116 g.20116  ORF g.20116 m.20116 type:complete len:74 (+) comp27974_c0_seq1:273-494(+)
MVKMSRRGIVVRTLNVNLRDFFICRFTVVVAYPISFLEGGHSSPTLVVTLSMCSEGSCGGFKDQICLLQGSFL